jgi:MoxR-like ATPase
MPDTVLTANPTTQTATAQVERTVATLRKVREAVGQAIFGQDTVIEQTLVTLLAGGHGLLIGVPGLAKTKLVETLGIVLGLDWKRIQFTPDLMPTDIIGSEVLEEDGGRRAFRFLNGPVFTQLLMADEINRASPRTQSALLQAMQERHVTVAGARYDLPSPFHVLATQNPLEQEGTYPLPEAQLDRFLLQIDIDYPDKAAERRMLLSTTFGEEAKPASVCTPDDLTTAQHIVRHIPVGEAVVDSILRLVRGARPGEEGLKDVREAIAWGPGPRASQAFMHPVLRHRMALTFPARAEGLTIASVIERLSRSLL